MNKKNNFHVLLHTTLLVFSSVILGVHAQDYSSLTIEYSGTIDSDLSDRFSLFVGKGILTEDIAISKTDYWADYVFEDNHKLPTLHELENFIDKNGHLPNIPSKDDVSEKGYDMHTMNVLFLEKIEELTLYLIAQQKKIDQLTSQLENECKLEDRYHRKPSNADFENNENCKP